MSIENLPVFVYRSRFWDLPDRLFRHFAPEGTGRGLHHRPVIHMMVGRPGTDRLLYESSETQLQERKDE